MQHRFSEDTRRVLAFAHNQAEESKAPHILVEHVLLGMLMDRSGPAAVAFSAAAIDARSLWKVIMADMPTFTTPPPAQLELGDPVKRLLEHSRDIAKNGIITQAHLLLAILEDEHTGRHLRTAGLTPGHIEVPTHVEESAQEKKVVYTTKRRQHELDLIGTRLKNANLHKQVHPVFWGMVGTVVGSALLLGLGILPNTAGVFLIVMFGWVVSVSLHEYGHAVVAYALGDDSILDKGYLTLNPILYTHGVLSVLLPIVFLLMGGIGLPGGAVYVDRNALRDYRYGAAVSAAGPFMTAVFAAICMVPLWLFFPYNVPRLTDTPSVWAAIGLLAFLQVTALILNLIPIPGLDGYGILEPWLPVHIQVAIRPLRRFGIMLLFILLIAVPAFNNVFWGGLMILSSVLGINPLLFVRGLEIFMFWRSMV